MDSSSNMNDININHLLCQGIRHRWHGYPQMNGAGGVHRLRRIPNCPSRFERSPSLGAEVAEDGHW